MRRLALTAALVATLLAPRIARAQASDIPSAAPPAPAGATAEERGRTLLDEMVTALGGDAWLNRTTMQTEGRAAAFFQGRPNPGSVTSTKTAASPSPARPMPCARLPQRPRHDPARQSQRCHPHLVRRPRLRDHLQGQDRAPQGAGRHLLPQSCPLHRRGHPLLDPRARRHGPLRRHWPGRAPLADKVTILTANNDAVTLELDATTHLPLRRTFQWRNPQFKDFDEEVETFDDYHTFQGLPTALTLTLYHNGDMTSQRYITKVVYNAPLAPDLFDPDLPTARKNEALSTTVILSAARISVSVLVLQRTTESRQLATCLYSVPA